jgi:hypothetical protein
VRPVGVGHLLVLPGLPSQAEGRGAGATGDPTPAPDGTPTVERARRCRRRRQRFTAQALDGVAASQAVLEV